MAVSDRIHSLSRLQEEFFFIVAKLHIYSYDDYQFCRFQSKFGKILPELSEDDFLALRACELYGSYDDWVTYNSWASVQPSVPTYIRDKEVDQSFQEFNPNLLREDESIDVFIENAEDLEALIACLLYGTADDWGYYLSWVSNPIALHDRIREEEVSVAFDEFNPNLFDCEDDDSADSYVPEMLECEYDCDYEKDRMSRSNRIKSKYLKDKKQVYNIYKILEAKCVKSLRDLLPGRTVEAYLCEDEDGLTIGNRAVLLKSFIVIRADSYFSSHRSVIKIRAEKARRQEDCWNSRRFGIFCEEDSKTSEVESCYILAPTYVDAQVRERYKNASHGGSLRKKVLYPAKFRLKTTCTHVRHTHQESPRVFIHGGPGLPSI